MLKKSFSPICLFCLSLVYFLIIVDSELSNNNLNDICDWCFEMKGLDIQRLLFCRIMH